MEPDQLMTDHRDELQRRQDTTRKDACDEVSPSLESCRNTRPPLSLAWSSLGGSRTPKMHLHPDAVTGLREPVLLRGQGVLDPVPGDVGLADVVPAEVEERLAEDEEEDEVVPLLEAEWVVDVFAGVVLDSVRRLGWLGLGVLLGLIDELVGGQGIVGGGHRSGGETGSALSWLLLD